MSETPKGRVVAIWLQAGWPLRAEFAWSLCLVRGQSAVNEVRWIPAMISRHWIAIFTSKRASIRDLDVREPVDRIINAERRTPLE